MMSTKVRVIDTTLRDGSHAPYHTQSPETVAGVCSVWSRPAYTPLRSATVPD